MKNKMKIIIPIALLVLVVALWPQRRLLIVRVVGLFSPIPTLSESVVGADSVEWFDDYFTIEYIDSKTIAIGEPRYHQQNYNYLIIGETRAILFDTGPGIRDIKPVVESLTTLPIIVSQSHLHYDHVGNHYKFDGAALPDLPHLRMRSQSGTLQLSSEEHLGFIEKFKAPNLTVSEWWALDSQIDLGGRTLTVIYAPGHTPDSIVLFDRDHKLLFAGDLIYPGLLMAMLPGSNINDYLSTTRRLVNMIPPDTRLLTAHGESSEKAGAPVLEYADLVDLQNAIEKIIAGTLKGKGFCIHSYLVNERIELLVDK
ncbi:MAG: MBL fold metallo-hydrolase [Chloroflexota bacterium]|nr:MBL fold metallo-hydrolase [Chloroflexota bacterium]